MNRLRNLIACLCPALLLAAVLARAETVFWSDNFAGNVGSRWTTNGVWQVGMPTFGPAGTHTGSNCATTGLRSSAPANVDTRLICTNYNGTNWLLVPATNQFPRLRFWQWFDFVNAGGYVEIRQQAGNTNWQTISATNQSIGFNPPSYSSGVWTRPSIDLSAFAGMNIQIAFHFSNGGNGYGSDPGWYIDEVTVVTNRPGFNNPEGFEAGLGDWSVDSGTWEVGTPTSGPPITNGFGAHSGTNCAGTVLAGDYGWNVDTRLISPPILVPASGSQVLRFWQWYSFVNAGGFVEVNNGTVATTTTTVTTIITNVTISLNTNIYQLFGAAITGYTTALYWNPTIGAWTNAAKAVGNVLDLLYSGSYQFEAGNAPFSSVGGANVDYRPISVIPFPQSASPTNFLVWQGLTWNSPNNSSDNPVGYFGTNYTFSYTTNTTTTTAGSSWQLVSPYIKGVGTASVNSGGWTNSAVDLSAYAGQTVQVAFHFQSGPSGWGNAPGWYVDDVGFSAAPTLNAPTNQTIAFGQMLTNTLSATNDLDPGSVFTFGLASASTNVLVNTNGMLTWTNTAAPPGTYAISVQVTDSQTPPFSITNNFSVTVLPLPSQLILTNAQVLASGGRRFKFSVNTPWTNFTWRILAATNVNGAATNWLPVYTNQSGVGGALQFTDLLATNCLQRYYRAVFP